LKTKIEDGQYVIKAEMPGIDPDKDVEITLNRERLVIDRCADRRILGGRWL
jgi:HSP20 family molecular chaperone IbpA